VISETRGGLGPLGRRLLVAFIVVALSSIFVLTVAALIGTSRGLAAGEEGRRQGAATDAAAAAASAYRVAGGWDRADLSAAAQVANSAGAGLAVFDASGQAVVSRGGMMQGGGMGAGMMGAGRGGVTAPVEIDGQAVGSVRLGFGSPSTGTAQTIAWTWIVIAAASALVVAVVVALFVSRRITRPLVRLTGVARSFAAGNRSARAAPEDVAAPGELGELARSFDATANDVVRSEEARRRMAADVAHELRTPLAALQAGLEELRDGLVEPNADRLAALHAQSVRLGRVIDDLSQLSSAETAALSLQRTTLDLAELVSDAVRAARPTLDAAGLDVSLDLAGGVTVDGDPDRLHQAVGNLLGNAARYCRPGDRVAVRVAVDPPQAVITVADTGPGIPADEIGHVFDRLWRGSADSAVTGSGIGLAVVRELVAAHGGSVDAASDGVSGATFVVRLPLGQRELA
jgi:two-component system sensor histidine kinase BaeS